MVKKMIGVALIVFMVYGLIGCSSKTPHRQADDYLAVHEMIDGNQDLVEAIIKSGLNKNACQATVTAVDGKQIENLAGFNFVCNPGGDQGMTDMVKYVMEGNMGMAQALTHNASSDWAKTWNTFFAGGWEFAKVATPWLGTYGITKTISNDYSSMFSKNSEAWAGAVGNVAENGGSTLEIRETVTEITDTSTVETSVYESTFGEGNVISGNQSNSDGSWYQSPFTDFNNTTPPVPEEPVIPAP